MERMEIPDEPAAERKVTGEPTITTTERVFTTKVDGWTRHADGENDNVYVRYQHSEPTADYAEGWSVMADNMTPDGVRQLGEWLLEFAKTVS